PWCSIIYDKADGVGILFKNDQVTVIKKREIIPGRLLLVDCFYQNHKFRLINVYTSQQFKKKCKLLRKMREILTVNYTTIICGDFNIITEEKDRIASTVYKTSKEGKLLKEISQEHDLIDAFRALNPNVYGFTRYDSKSKTRIDRIYTSSNVKILSYKPS
uniref:Endonuclease/exonuclease/phosphatase domain-containing protein n=1 Tax=Neogobius melanostomus TaxID=47308 RepID=A0A8C6U1L7_9GOBI